jgi:hypothetical protein
MPVVWWGGAPQSRRSRAKSTERSGLGARSRPLSPCPPCTRGKGRSAPPGHPSHWKTGSGSGRAWPERVPPYPWLWFIKLVGQGDSGQQHAVHWHRVSLGERWESAPWPGPPRGRVVHAPAGGGGQGHFSTAGARTTSVTSERPALGRSSVSPLRAATLLRS